MILLKIIFFVLLFIIVGFTLLVLFEYIKATFEINKGINNELDLFYKPNNYPLLKSWKIKRMYLNKIRKFNLAYTFFYNFRGKSAETTLKFPDQMDADHEIELYKKWIHIIVAI